MWILGHKVPLPVLVFAVCFAFLAYVLLSGTSLTAAHTSHEVHISARFLGDYALGLQRMQIRRQAEHDDVVCQYDGTMPSDLYFQAGHNTFSRVTHQTKPKSDWACDLRQDEGYILTVWGNNGFGDIRPSTLSFIP